MVGKCLYESAHGRTYAQHLPARLAKSFLAQLVGLRVHYKEPYLYDVNKMYAIFVHLPLVRISRNLSAVVTRKIREFLNPPPPSAWTSYVHGP